MQGKDRSDDQERAHRGSGRQGADDEDRGSAAVDATFDAITSTLKKGGEVKIMGFGDFRVVKRAAREGRDPRTGAPVKIKAAKRPRFSAGKGLKDAVNR